MKKNIKKFSFLLLLLGIKVGFAAVKPNTLFTNNGVLQQGIEVPVWGTAAEGEKVTVEFAGQSITTTTQDGKWMVKLKPLKASTQPQNMTVKGENTVTISNVLVGEVWLCSGQSNMGFALNRLKPLNGYPALSEVIKDAQNYPQIRQYFVPSNKISDYQLVVDDVNGKWNVCDSKSITSFAAVSYFFARDLCKKLNVPVGLILSAYGGTGIDRWMNKEALLSNPELKAPMEKYIKSIKEYEPKLQEYLKNEAALLKTFSADSALAAQQGKSLPKKPVAPVNPAAPTAISLLYNTMIKPLIPYAIKGAVWYQGEANRNSGQLYRTLLPTLIQSWRTEWKQGEFPFLYVQIPGWPTVAPELREAQLLTLQKAKNTAMVVTYDCDDTLDVHPGNKQPVGERLALAGRAVAYGEKIVYSGPVYKSMKVKANKIILDFDHVGGGLVAKGDELKDFTIAGEDKKFVPGKAKIVKNKIEVTAEGIDKPVAVRAGWRFCPQMNLYNKENLPATPFRTDVQ